jgi:hypothetical protein
VAAARTVQEYMGRVGAPQREVVEELIALVRKAARKARLSIKWA